MVATARAALEGHEVGVRLLLLCRSILLLLLPRLLLQLRNGWAVKASVGDAAMLERAAVETWTVIIVALSDHLTTANDDAAVAVVKWRLHGLLKAEGQVVVGLHLSVSLGFVWTWEKYVSQRTWNMVSL